MKFLIFASFLLILNVSSVYSLEGGKEAHENLDLRDSFENSREALHSIENISVGPNWYLGKIRLRTRAKIGLEVPFLAKLEVVPFVEFHFKR